MSLFGIDLAGEIANAFASSAPLNDVTLTVFTPGTRGAILADGTNPTSTTVTGKGTLSATQFREEGTLRTGEVLLVLGGSLSPAGVPPKAGDLGAIGGVTYRLIRLLELDPAQAAYSFLVER